MNPRYLLLSATLIAAGSYLAHASSAPFLREFNYPAPTVDWAEKLVEAQQEQLYVDSLLNSIEIDSITREVASINHSIFYIPNILGSLDRNQYGGDDIPLSSYSDLAGVVYWNRPDGNEEPDEEGEENEVEDCTIIYPASLEFSEAIPEWFVRSLRWQNAVKDASFKMMIRNPYTVEYADWNLPLPPRFHKDDHSFRAFLRTLNLPEEGMEVDVVPEVEIKHKNWIHYFNVGLQVSQAYVSSNWYQGGNSYVAGLFNFTWNVDLNTVFHPNLLFQSSLQYKLGVNSNPKGSLHKYNTSQDLFQYNLKTGLKAFNHWFYSLNLLFNTQLFNSYPEDSMQRNSSLLSPGTLNLGLGMTYTLSKNGVSLSLSISPLAYNLKTCIASDIDHMQFNIEQNRKTLSEIGSSAEANLTWKFTDNISWKSRMFIFTDYGYFLADWENTFNFQLNKFLSTQIYIYPRFDSSSEANTKWRHWMLREILSFGISYTFATPK